MRAKDTSSHASESDACRLDIWLYRTRLLKTRALAGHLISKGKIRLRRNGQMERIKKPHALIRPGDQVTFMRGTELINAEMIASGTRRGPASEAQTLYLRLDDTESAS
ncbi:heat shock protein Hsp15 [Litorimonas taeanensis]|uniref:Heat shock protein Hsp15 n=1 Tax=Litorimonas taeanensis TaxID=568099 RepID=A0A420WCX0_9PROT|nr:S4 domain-containing protein [Litorimonas taeanensis]RKQ68818.1 heat shock protein Hsp15 [Litorimonas taeanensis]